MAYEPEGCKKLKRPGAHFKGMLQIHGAVFLFGFAGLFGKFVDTSPLYIVMGRTFFGALALGGYSRYISKSGLGGLNLRDGIFCALQGMLLAAHWVLFFLSIQVSSVAVGLVTFSSFPLFATFMEPWVFRERLRFLDLAAALMVCAGIILVVPDLDLSNRITLGAIYGILSGFTFALLALVNRRNVRKFNAVVLAFYQNGFAALCLILPILLARPALPGISELPLLILLGVVFTALAHTWFIRSLTIIRVQTASVIAGLEPVYGILFAFILLNEVPGPTTLAGGVLIIGATIGAGLLSRTGP